MLRIALIGLGNVGKAFVKVLLAKAGELAKLGYEPCVVGALASRGGVVGDGCLSNKLLAELADKGLYGTTEVRGIGLGEFRRTVEWYLANRWWWEPLVDGYVLRDEPW